METETLIFEQLGSKLYRVIKRVLADHKLSEEVLGFTNDPEDWPNPTNAKIVHVKQQAFCLAA